jgi:hypothetical protein
MEKRQANSGNEYGFAFTARDLQVLKELHVKIVKEVRDIGADPSKYCSPNLLGRIFYAKQYNPVQAYEMWNEWLQWRLTECPDKIPESAIMHELERGKAFWHKEDKKGNPCLIIQSSKHIIDEFPREESIKFVIYTCERGMALAEESKTNKICCIWDRAGVSKRNFDPDLLKDISHMLTQFYAEALDAIYVLHPSWLLRIALATIRPFLPERTRNKIIVVPDVEDLLEHFDRSCLLVEHGGTSEFKYSWPDHTEDIVERWYDCRSEWET